MTDLTERKLKACQVKPIDTKPYSDELQELKEENTKLKAQNKRLRGIIKTCQRYLDNQSITDAWAESIKIDIDDSMGDLGMEEIK